MKSWNRRILSLAACATLPGVSFAGGVSGTVTSAEKIDDEAKAAVVWIEGVKQFEPPAESVKISQSGIQFSPRVLVVTEGQAVDMPNEDDVAHNVFSLSPAKKFDLGIYPKGQSKTVTFEKPGVINLFCKIHRHMNAVIVVTPSPHAAQTAVGESYSIDDVPPGDYTLHYWNSTSGEKTEKITIPADGDATLDLTI